MSISSMLPVLAAMMSVVALGVLARVGAKPAMVVMGVAGFWLIILGIFFP